MLKRFNHIYTQAIILFILTYIGWYFKIPVFVGVVFTLLTVYNIFILKQNKILPYVWMAVIPLLDVTHLYYHQYDSGSASNASVFLPLFYACLTIIIIMIVNIIINRKKMMNLDILVVFAIFFLSIIPSFFNTSTMHIFSTFANYLPPLILMLIVATVDDFTLTDISLVIVSLALQSSLDMLTMFIQGDMIHMIVNKRINIYWSISSNIGSYIVFALPFMIYLVYKFEKITFITIPTSIWLVVAMFASGARNAMLAFAVIFIPLVILAIRHIHKQYKIRAILSVLIGAIVLGYIFHYTGILEAILTRLLEKGLEDSGRFRLWEIGVQMFKNSPIIGEGMFSLTNYTAEFSTHNIIIDTLAFTGIVGLAGLVCLAGWVIRQVFRNFDNKFIIIFVAITAFFVTALVDTSHYNPISLCLLLIPIPYFAKMNEVKCDPLSIK